MISKKYLYLILVIFAASSFSQAIDQSLLSQLSPDQIQKVQESLLEQNSIDGEDVEMSLQVESLIDKELASTEDEIISRKFGYDFFSKIPTSLTAIGDLPLPNEYRISLRDQLRVILSGSKDSIFNLNVRLDGTILFPEIGSISVVGKTFGEVKDLLSQKISESYIGVNIDVAIKDLSAKKITIVGAVETPGTYLVNPFSTITSALAYSGGVSEIGSLRNIKLIRSDGSTYAFDLYDLLIRGDRENDINVQAGDTILITAANQFVEINGSVNRPGIYELDKNETIQDAIDFSLGFTQTANKSNISISVLDLESASVIKKTTDNLGHKLENVLDINVFSYVSQDRSAVQVIGSVRQPGFYSLETFSTLNELIEGLEFIDTYPWLGVLEQFDDENLIKSSTLFSLKDKNTYQDIALLPNSRVFFANIESRSFDVNENSRYLIDQYSISIDHAQGIYKLPIFGKFSVLDLVNLLGLNMDDVEREVTYISPSENLIINEEYTDLNLVAQKYNYLKFRSPVNDLITVEISGAVEFPGSYTLKPNTSIQDVYDLLGGFKNEAFLEGIILTRDSIREVQIEAVERAKKILESAIIGSVQNGESEQDLDLLMASASSNNIDMKYLGRISGDFSPSSFGALNTILYDGDSITIPKYPSTINVFGEVLNPLSFQYKEGIDLRDAISTAGGFRSFADQSKVYIIRANGEVEKSGRNLFTNNVELEVGDTIIVPRKFATTNPVLRSLAPITQILSDVAFSAAAIESLSSN